MEIRPHPLNIFSYNETNKKHDEERVLAPFSVALPVSMLRLRLETGVSTGIGAQT
jgi:hypothetical protein